MATTHVPSRAKILLVTACLSSILSASTLALGGSRLHLDLAEIGLKAENIEYVGTIGYRGEPSWSTGEDASIDRTNVVMALKGSETGRSLSLSFMEGASEASSCDVFGSCTPVPTQKRRGRLELELEAGTLRIDSYGKPCRNGKQCQLRIPSWRLANSLAGWPRILTVIATAQKMLFVESATGRVFFQQRFAVSEEVLALGSVTGVTQYGPVILITHRRGTQLFSLRSDRHLLVSRSGIYLNELGLGAASRDIWRPLFTPADTQLLSANDMFVVWSAGYQSLDIDKEDIIGIVGEMVPSSIESVLLTRNTARLVTSDGNHKVLSRESADEILVEQVATKTGLKIKDDGRWIRTSLGRKDAEYILDGVGGVFLKEQSDGLCIWKHLVPHAKMPESLIESGLTAECGAVHGYHAGDITSITTLSGNLITIDVR